MLNLTVRVNLCRFSCLIQITRLQSMQKIFFVSFYKCMADSSVLDTVMRQYEYSAQPCERCLWPSGKIINHPKSPSAAFMPPLSHSTFLYHLGFSHSFVFGKHHLSLTLSFCCLATLSPSLPFFFFSTHMHTNTHTYTADFHKNHTFHCLDTTHLRRSLSVSCLSECVFVRVYSWISGCLFMERWVWDHHPVTWV